MANTIRDTEAMERFSMAIEAFDERIESICSRMEAAISMAESGMNDDSTKQAAEVLYDLISSVKSVTTPMDDVGSSISKGAKILKRAEDINYRR